MTARRSVLWPRMRSVWPLLLSVLLSTLIASSLVAAFAGFAAAALPQAVSSELVSSSARSITISGAIDAAQLLTDRQAVRAAIGHAFAGVPATSADAVWSDPLGLPAPRGAKTIPLVQAAVMGGIKSQARLTAGRWPSGTGQAGTGRAGAGRASNVPAAIPASVAVTLGLKVGQYVPTRDRQTGARVRFLITGLYQPLNRAAAYWGLDLISPAGVSTQPGFVTYGPLVVAPGAFARGGGVAIGGATWLYGLGTTELAAAQLRPLAARVTHALGFLARSADLGGLQTASGLPALLNSVATKLVVARSLLLVGELELLLLAGAALTLTARTLASQREDESATLSARGAGRRQLVAMALSEALLITMLAAAAGAWLGSWLTGLLARVGALRAVGLKLSGIPADDWRTVGVVLLLCTAILIWPALRSVSPGQARVRRGRRGTALMAASAGADVALIALAGLAGWQLREFSVLGRTSAGLGVDPVLALAPAIALAAGTVLPLRLLPLLARAGDRLAARTRQFGSAMTSWELSRRATRQSAPMLLVVLAVGTSTLALAQHQSWRQSALDQSAFVAGADVRADTLLPATLGTSGTIAHAAGVTAAMPVSTVVAAPGAGQVIALDSRLGPSAVLLRGDESVPGLWQRLAPPKASGLITLPGRPARLRVTASLSPGRGPSVGPVSLTVSVQDAAGIIYAVPAGALPADGRAHGLVVTLTSSGQAIYPLRLIAITADFTLPPVPGRAGRAAAASRVATFSVTGLATSASLTGPVGDQLAAPRLLARWVPRVSAPDLAESGTGRPPALVSVAGSGSGPVSFHPGDGEVVGLFDSATSSLGGQVTVAAVLPHRIIPVIATTAFLHSQHLTVGAPLQLAAAQTAVTARIVAAVKSFPTITNVAGGLIVDQAAVQEALAAQGQPPIAVTQWWLATRSGGVPRGLPAGTALTVRARMAGVLLSDPMSVIPQQAIQATAIAAALLAILGFSVSVAGSVRERRSQTALLAALGVPGRAQARLLSIEALALSLPAAVTGLLLGAVLAHLLVPSITLTSTAAAPVVPVLVKVPVGAAMTIALVVTAIPVLAAAASAIYRPDPAAQLRAAEAA